MTCYRYRVLRLVRETYDVEIISENEPTKEHANALAENPANVEIRSWSAELVEVSPIPEQPNQPAAPIIAMDPHLFEKVRDNPYCGRCGASERHPIHSDVRCSDCAMPAGSQHRPGCHRQGIVTRESDYRDR
jgi:NADH pyrophosphatase NudC (nudix superfamily)